MKTLIHVGKDIKLLISSAKVIISKVIVCMTYTLVVFSITSIYFPGHRYMKDTAYIPRRCYNSIYIYSYIYTTYTCIYHI